MKYSLNFQVVSPPLGNEDMTDIFSIPFVDLKLKQVIRYYTQTCLN